METNPFCRKHYPGLDVLRGVAILLVILFHYFSFPLGWIGVDLFFVLSGFLITKSLLERREQPGYFRIFFTRRVLRIFPVYFLMLALFFAAAPFLFSEKGQGSVYAYYTGNQVWFWTFTQNWLFIRKGVPPEPYLQHFWSLAIEEQFYLCWPFLLYWVKNSNYLRTIMVAIFLFALCFRIFLWYHPAGHKPFYYHSLARIDSLSAGAFLSVSVMLRKKFSKTFTWSILLGFGSLLAASFLLYRNWRLDNAVFATVGYSLSALFFLLLCRQMVYSTNTFSKLSLLKAAGRISYGLYVYHIPVFLLVSFLLGRYASFLFTEYGLPLYSISVFSLVATIAVSLVSYRLVEKPLLQLKNRLARPATKTTVHAYEDVHTDKPA